MRMSMLVRIVSMMVMLGLGTIAVPFSAAANHGSATDTIEGCWELHSSTPGALGFGSTHSYFWNSNGLVEYWCQVATGEVTTLVETAHGFAREVTVTAGIIRHTFNYDVPGEHTASDTRETVPGTCYSPDGDALPDKAADRNPNCALPAQ